MERACGAGLLLGCVTDGVLCADLSPHQTFSVSSECNCASVSRPGWRIRPAASGPRRWAVQGRAPLALGDLVIVRGVRQAALCASGQVAELSGRAGGALAGHLLPTPRPGPPVSASVWKCPPAVSSCLGLLRLL